MMIRYLTIIAFVVFTAGCNTLGNRAELLTEVLDSKPDGFSEKLGPKYTIVSTKVSGPNATTRRLCRVVSFEENDSFEVKTYCKKKGGTWQ